MYLKNRFKTIKKVFKCGKQKKKKKSQRAHSNVKNSQMLVFKMENSGHKLE